MTFSGMPIPVAIVLVLVITTVIGALIGLIVTRTAIHSLIVTLAIGSVLSGITYWYTAGNVLFDGVPTGFSRIARSDVLGIPLPFVYLIIITTLAALFLAGRPLGRQMYAIGGNRSAARLAGISVEPLVMAAFAASGFFAGLAGVLIASRLNSAQAGLGPNFLLPAFAAAYLGATVIRPGRFNPFGVVIAVFLLATTASGLQLAGVPSWAESVFNGTALLVAVAVSHRIARMKRQRAESRAAEL
jgi:ribose transport system permease protein